MFIIVIILILVCIIIFLCLTIRRYKIDIKRIISLLSVEKDDCKNKKLFLYSSNKSIKELVSSINKLLNLNSKVYLNQQNKEIAMKKMISNISHDLKTPLTVIIGYSEIIKLNSSKMDVNNISQLNNKVYNKSNELLGTINEFFNLAKLESGDYNFQFKKINISEICRKVVLGYYDILNKKQISVKLELTKEDFWILADEKSIIRILNNIVSNVINYGYEGKVLGIKLSDDIDNVIVEIWDRGKGIPEKDYNLIFERLYTLEDSRNKNYQGNGIGLSITKRLVELMKGKIYVKSSSYEKTSFYLVFKKI